MRLLLALAALLVVATTPAAAQRGEMARVDREVGEAARWLESVGEALAKSAEGFPALNQEAQALAASRPTPEQARAASSALRGLIDRARASVRSSEALLAALPPYPAGIPTDVTPQEVVRDARAYNAGLLKLLDDFETFAVALGEGDASAMGRAMPRIMEGAFSMLGNQRLVIRNRQAATPATESSHQSLGVAAQIYRAMEAAARSWLAARQGGGAGADKAAATLGEELRGVASDTRALAVRGRKNLAGEIAQIDSLRRAGSDPVEIRLLERVGAALRADEKVFELADRLADFAEANAAITGAQLAASPRPQLLPPLTEMEASYMALVQEQAGLLAEGAPQGP
jgi:hypothetical protein